MMMCLLRATVLADSHRADIYAQPQRLIKSLAPRIERATPQSRLPERTLDARPRRACSRPHRARYRRRRAQKEETNRPEAYTDAASREPQDAAQSCGRRARAATANTNYYEKRSARAYAPRGHLETKAAQTPCSVQGRPQRNTTAE